MGTIKRLGLLIALVLVFLMSPACRQDDTVVPGPAESDPAVSGFGVLEQSAVISYIAEPIEILDIGNAPLSFGAFILHDAQIIIPMINTGIKFADEHIDEYSTGWNLIAGNMRVEDFGSLTLSGEVRTVGEDVFYGEDFFTIPVFQLVSVDIDNEYPTEEELALIPFDVGDRVRIVAVCVSDAGFVRLIVTVYSEERGLSLRHYQFPFYSSSAEYNEIDMELLGGHHSLIQDAWFDNDGNVLMSVLNTRTDSRSLVVLDATLTNRLASLEIDNTATLLHDSNGQIWGIEERRQLTGLPDSTLRRLDSTAWTWEDETILQLYDASGLHAAPDESIFTWFIHTPFNLFGLTEDGELTEYISWMDVDVTVNHNTTLLFPTDGEILVLNQTENAHDDIFMTLDSVILRRADEGVIDDREILTIGGVNLIGDAALADLIRRFNRTSETHRAVIADYAEQGWDGAPIRLQVELMTGSGPDVLLFSQWGDRNDIVPPMMRGGFLADLNVFLDNDPLLSRDDFFENILDIWVNDAGEQSIIVSTVIPAPYWGNAENVADFTDFTHEGFIEFVRSSKERGVAYPMGLNYLPYIVLQTMVFADDTFFCYRTGEANFDSELFLDILAHAASIPEEQQALWDASRRTEEGSDPVPFMLRGEQFLSGMSGFLSVHDFRVADATLGGLAAVGAPNRAGALAIPTRPITRMGIRANSPNAEAAWEFIRLELMEPNAVGVQGLPVIRELFDAEIQSEKDRGAFESGGFFGFGGGEQVVSELSEERAMMLRSIMEHITHEYHPDPFIMEVIWDEVTPFLAGSRSAEDAARIIQSRVSIYLSEQLR